MGMLYEKNHSLTVNQIIFSAAIYCWNATVGQSTFSCPQDEMDQIPHFDRIQVRVITAFTVFRLMTDFVCLYNYEF
jgi:hypothetical protein